MSVLYTMRTIQTLGKVNQRTLRNAFGFRTIRDAKKSLNVNTNEEAYELMKELYNMNVVEVKKNEMMKKKTIKEGDIIRKNVIQLTANDNIHKEMGKFNGKNIVIVLVDNKKIIKSVQHDIPSSYNDWWKRYGYFIFHNSTDSNGFFEDYPNGKAYIYEEKTNIKPKQITQFFKEGNTNCLLTPIYDWAYDKLNDALSVKSQERYTTILNKINKLMSQYHNEGINENLIQEISSKLQIDISVYKPLCDINYIEAKSNKKALKHFKYINTKCGHVDLNELVNETDYEVVSREKMFEISQELKSNNSFFHFTRDLIGYRKIITIGKSYRISNEFMDFINDFEKDTGLKYCKIDDIKDVELSRFIKCGTHYNGTIDFKDVKKIDKKNINHIDMEKAYTKYKMTKYYEGFLGKITDFRKCNTIQGVGLYQINNLIIPTGKFKRLNDKMNMYKNDNVYTSAELKMLTDYGVKYNIVCGAWGIKPIDFDLDDEMFLNKYDEVSGYAKWVGICDIHSLNYKTYMNGDIDMYSIMEQNTTGTINFYENERTRYNFDNSQGEISVSYPKKSNFHLGHITSFILSYQRLNAIDQLINMDYDNLIRICVDGIYFKGDTKLYNCFRHKKSLKLGNEECDSYITNNYKYLKFDCGEEREFNHNELHIGSGGNGKTHLNLTDKGLVRPLYIAPSWKLSSKKFEEYGIKNNVWANVYTTDTEKIDLIKKYHNTIIIDEVSMMTEDCKNYILNEYKSLKLIFCGDVGFQAPPFNKVGEEKAIEMNCEGFKKVIHRTFIHTSSF